MASSQTLQLLNTTNKLLELNTQQEGSQPELLKAIAELLRAIFRKVEGDGKFKASPTYSLTVITKTDGESKRHVLHAGRARPRKARRTPPRAPSAACLN